MVSRFEHRVGTCKWEVTCSTELLNSYEVLMMSPPDPAFRIKRNGETSARSL